MKFTLSWLKEYLKTDKDINTILENLTNIGLEVEESFDQYSVYKDFKVATRGRISKKDLDKVLNGKLDKADVLCSDSHRSYGAFAKANTIEHKKFIQFLN